MKYAVEMGSDAMIYIPNFTKIGKKGKAIPVPGHGGP
jgi:hypothetical protein